jgi:multidrug efflux pump subunit AcrA (membrane-fusion protein)
MAIGALIGAYQEEDSGQLRALLPLAGRSLIEYQVRCVAAAGAAPIVVVVERVPQALQDIFERLRLDGIGVVPVSDIDEAVSRFEAGSTILLIGDGVVAPAEMVAGLADETGTPHEGKLVFLDNELDPNTGTIHARGLFANKDRRFTPGMFARVKLIGSGQYDALLINDSAVGTDQSVKFVLKVGAGNKIEYTPVKLGPVIDGLRVVREGLSAGDVIVVKGLQMVRPGMPVTPQSAMASNDRVVKTARR